MHEAVQLVGPVPTVKAAPSYVEVVGPEGPGEGVHAGQHSEGVGGSPLEHQLARLLFVDLPQPVSDDIHGLIPGYLLPLGVHADALLGVRPHKGNVHAVGVIQGHDPRCTLPAQPPVAYGAFRVALYFGQDTIYPVGLDGTHSITQGTGRGDPHIFLYPPWCRLADSHRTSFYQAGAANPRLWPGGRRPALPRTRLR